MKELRIGLVLYGGVSLAIYMNGISTELWHLLRASKARRDGTTDQLDDTASIYADLLDDLAKLARNDLRVVVDVIAGTSAGGVNAAVLAKAIVDGGDASVLNRVWLEDADISKLRSEPAARSPWYLRAALSVFALADGPVRSLKVRVSRVPGVSWDWVRDHLYSMIMSSDGRSTPLDGNFFTHMIAKTFSDMGSGNALLPKRASFDLFVTRTDLQGWPRHLPVSEEFHSEPLYEKTHAHVMRFRRKPCGGGLQDDFGLTYATRSTASFPVAFAPVNYDTVKAAYESARPGGRVPVNDQFARDHFPEHALFDFPVDCAWMVDGGVLDNKPFTHVARAIEHKPAEHEVYRVVAYVEPDPEPNPAPSASVSIPRPLQVAANLYRLFRHEPIHEDLCRLRDRNKKVTDLKALLDANKNHARRLARVAGRRQGLKWPPVQADADNWRKATNAFSASAFLSGYPGYFVLKARSAADFLANVTCIALGYPYASRHAYFVRQFIRAWVHEQGALNPPELGTPIGYTVSQAQRLLLKAFDVPFRLRRIHALVRATNESYKGSSAAECRKPL
ncbi:MAG: patatin-like protein [Boseongicola sp.]|nr:patatin-like protein [Boseongicola sp.]